MEFLSPLRYPGGKGKIANYIKLLFEKNDLADGLYIEPYAGGASVALSLLFSEYARKIVINDFDKSIYAFWHSVLYSTEQLCRLINDTEVSLENWSRLRELQKRKDEVSLLELGFSTFYQNRTNRSGIIKGGIIGGKDQTGNWKLDARFNKKDLIKRIQKIAKFKERIGLYNLDAINLIRQLEPSIPPKTLFYFDPPYYDKGPDLYVNYYGHEDHVMLSKTIRDLKKGLWLISYDNVPQIHSIYEEYRKTVYALNYSAAKPTEGSEVLIFHNKLQVPIVYNPVRIKLDSSRLLQSLITTF